jgi:PII-like signaling protein
MGAVLSSPTLGDRVAAQKLTVIIGDDQRWGREPVSHEILRRAQAQGIAGASVFRGVEGFGLSRIVHTTRFLDLADDLPVVIVIVDTVGRLSEFVPQVQEVLAEGLILLEDVEQVCVPSHDKRTDSQRGEAR